MTSSSGTRGGLALSRILLGVVGGLAALLVLPVAVIGLAQWVSDERAGVDLPVNLAPYGVLVLIGSFGRTLWRTGRALLGVGFERWRLSAARAWAAQDPSVKSGEAVVFHMLGVSRTEVARVGAGSVGNYWWMRRIERRTGIRFGDEQWSSGGWARITVSDLREEVDIAVGGRWTWWTRPAVRRALAARVRALVQVIGLTGPVSGGGVGWGVVRDAATLLRAGQDPGDVVGWVQAYRVLVIEQGWSRLPSLVCFQDEWPDEGDLPGWLRVLAGFGAGEKAPAGTSRNDLVVLAVLRGHSVLDCTG